MNQTLQTHWNAFRRQPTDATFEPLFIHSRALVYTICLRILRNPDDAADAFQGVYGRLLTLARETADDDTARPASQSTPSTTRKKNADNLESLENDISAVISRLAVREANALSKRLGRRARKEVAMDCPPDVATEGLSADQIAARHETRQKIETLITTLPDKYRVPLTLHFFDGMTQTQIAAALDTPIATVSWRIRRALQKLNPLMRRAGLGETLSVLAAISVSARLIDPPAALGASAVFARAATLATASTAGGTTLTSVTAPLASLKGMAGLGAMAALVATLFFAWMGSPPAGPIGDISADSPSSFISPSESHEEMPTIYDGDSEASPEPALSPTPSPTPPPRDVALRLVWQDNQAPLANASFVMRPVPEDAITSAPLHGITADDGQTTFTVPGHWSRLRLDVDHPHAASQPELALPLDTPRDVAIYRGGALFGKAFLDGDAGEPVRDGVVGMLDSPHQAPIAPDGTWRLTGLPASKNWRLYAAAGDYVSYQREDEVEKVSVQAGMDNGPVHLVLKKGRSLSGRVTAIPDGVPIADATVAMQGGRGVTVRTDPEGKYRMAGLPVGNFTLTAQAPDHATARRLTLIGEQSDNFLDFQLEAGGVVHVQVLTQDGKKPVEDAKVRARDDDDVGAYDETAVVLSDGAGKATLTGVSMTNPPTITAHSSEFNSCRSARPVFTGDATIAQVTVLVDKYEEDPATEETHHLQGGVFVGTVTDVAGAPVAGALVGWGTHFFTQGGEARTDEAGQYRLVTSADLPRRSSYQPVVMAAAQGFAPHWEMGVTPGTPEAPTRVDMTLEPGHWIDLQVNDIKGDPVPKVSVSTDGWQSNRAMPLPPAFNHKTSDANGFLRLSDLPDGEVRLNVTKNGFSHQNLIGVAVDQSLDIVLKPLGVIRGQVVDAGADQPIHAFTVQFPNGGQSVADALRSPGLSVWAGDGVFEIDNLHQSYTYNLTIQAEGYTPREVKDVTPIAPDSDEVVQIALTAGEPLRGALVDAETGAPIAGARVGYFIPRDGGHFTLNWNQPGDPTWDDRNIQRMITGPDGAFTFQEWNDKGLVVIKPRTHERMLLFPGQRHRYQNAETGELTIPLPQGAALKGTVVQDKEPLSGVAMELQKNHDNLGYSMRFVPLVTDDKGAFAWTGLEPGRYSIAYADSRMEVALERGETKTLRLSPPSGQGVVTGKVFLGDEPLEEINVSLNTIQTRTAGASNSPDGQLVNAVDQSRPDGTYRFENLPRGRYSLNLAHHLPEIGARWVREEVEIQTDGETVFRDLIVAPSHTLSLTLDASETVLRSLRANQVTISLNRVNHIYSPDNKRQIDNSASFHGEILNNRVELSGRFSGEYRLKISYTDNADQRRTITLDDLPPLYTLDGDQDLGVIALPDQPGYTLSGRVTLADGSPMPQGSVSASPQEAGGAAASTSVDDEGNYRLSDLSPGAYIIRVNGQVDDVPCQATAQVDLWDDTRLDLVARGRHKVIIQLTADDEDGKRLIDNLSQASLALTPEAAQDRPDLEISRSGHASTPQGGLLTFEGRFLGAYQLQIRVSSPNIPSNVITLEVQLDNLDRDQGPIPVALPRMGALQVDIQHPSAPAPMESGQGHAALFLESTDDSVQPMTIQLDLSQPTQTLRSIPFGEYQATFFCPGFKTSPRTLAVEVAPDATPVVSTSLTPDGFLVGMFRTDSEERVREFPVRSVTLRGPTRQAPGRQTDQTLTTVAAPEEIDHLMMMISDQNLLFSRGFIFRNLAGGQYEVTVEADGYAPWSAVISITPGRIVEHPVELTREP